MPPPARWGSPIACAAIAVIRSGRTDWAELERAVWKAFRIPPVSSEMAWRKSWCKQNLDPHGTKRQLTPEQRSVWDDLLDLAEVSPVTGHVCAFPGIGYTTEQLAAILNTPAKIIQETLERFRSKECDMIDVDRHGVITIKNWPKYQSEYQRQKGYRRK